LDSLMRYGDALIVLTLNELLAPGATVRIVQCAREGCGRFLVQDYSTSGAGAKPRYCPAPLGPHGRGCKLSNAEKLQRLRAKRNSSSTPFTSRRSERR